MSPPDRLRYSALLPLWCLFTRSVVKDASLSGWGFSFALMAACFFMFVAKSQIAWLGKSKDFWWKVGVRAENAAFFAAVMPKSYLLPFLGFLLVVVSFGRTSSTVLSSGALDSPMSGRNWRGALHASRDANVGLVSAAHELSGHSRSRCLSSAGAPPSAALPTGCLTD